MQKSQSTASSVPRSRLERLAHLGGLAGRVAGGMLAEGIRQVAKGNMQVRVGVGINRVASDSAMQNHEPAILIHPISEPL